MNYLKVVNVVGLTAGMVGVAIIFRWGPPQPNLEEGVALELEDATPLKDGKTGTEHNEMVRQTRTKYQFMSRLGLALVGIRFAFQLFAAISAD